MSNQNQKNNNNKWLAFVNIPIQMGVIIFGVTYFGIWLDERLKNQSNLFTIVFSLVSVFISLYNILRQVKNLNNNK
jgi:F0F1-type ATP synthase assembly protein I